MQPRHSLTVLMTQTRQAVCAIHQSILLRCLGTQVTSRFSFAAHWPFDFGGGRKIRPWRKGRIFIRVQPFYERAVSDLDP